MATFTFTALKPDGSTATGDLDVTDRAEAIAMLDRKGWQPVSLNVKGEAGADAKAAAKGKEGEEGGMPYQLVEQDMKLGLLPGVFNYVVRHNMQPYDRIDFKRQSGDLKDIEGYWKFVPLDGEKKTLLVYQLHIVPGMFIPGIVVRSGLKKSLPSALIGIRDRVATHGPVTGAAE